VRQSFQQEQEARANDTKPATDADEIKHAAGGVRAQRS
jgi:hypothetical protein